MRDGQLILAADEDWAGLTAGALGWVSLKNAKAGQLVPQVLFAPNVRQAYNSIVQTRSTLVLFYSDNVRGRAKTLRWTGATWVENPLPLPDNASLSPVSFSPLDDVGYVLVSGFLTPSTLVTLDLNHAVPVPVTAKVGPVRFVADGLVVTQKQACSSDGTLIPYFLVHRADAPTDGSVPTLITAYGGFQVPMLPGYDGLTGKLWLERGGQYVVANIRGGGEFGPAWHDAGRKTRRQIIYDDFYAVAQDLVDQGRTSPEKLGIFGGSNGGLLMGVALTQRPDLWGAVAIQVPLLDMLRYEQIAAGTSWRDEYGSVTVPEERAFLASISPYHQLVAGRDYPETLIWTSTGDDRVGPHHARKFAARMAELGLPYLFYEDTAGGHGADGNVEQVARLRALEMTYFARALNLAKNHRFSHGP